VAGPEHPGPWAGTGGNGRLFGASLVDLSALHAELPRAQQEASNFDSGG